MKTPAWMLCCLGLLAPLHFAGADEPPQGFVKITLGVEGEGLESIPIVGAWLKHLIPGGDQPCAEEMLLQLPPPPECPACAASEQCVPLLSKLPYVNRLFTNVRSAAASEDCETVDVDCPPLQARELRFVGPDGLERIGIDFDFDVPNCAQCQATRCPAPVAVCPAPVCTAPSCEVVSADMAMAMYHAQQVQSFADRDELIEALMEARIEAAVAQTALKVREESDTKQLELIKELLSSQVENARLTAKLELAAEKEKMLAELYEARVELTALQAQVARSSEVAQRKRQRKDAEARRPAEAAESLR